MEKYPQNLDLVSPPIYSVDYRGLECEVVCREAILSGGGPDFEEFHTEKFAEGHVRSVVFDKKRTFEENVPFDAYRGKIILEDDGAGKTDSYINLLSSLNARVDERDYSYEGITILCSGKPEIVYATSHDGVGYTIFVRKAAKEKDVVIEFGNIASSPDTNETVGLPYNATSDGGDNFDGFLKVYMHLLDRISRVHEDANKFRSTPLRIGKPVTPGADVFVNYVRDMFDHSLDIDTENLHTLPGIDEITRKAFMRISGVEGSGHQEEADYSRAVLLSGGGLDRAYEIVAAFAKTIDADYKVLDGGELRGRTSKETEYKSDKIFKSICKSNDPTVLLINDLEAAYRHQNGRASGIKALQRVIAYMVDQNSNLYVFATVPRKERIPEILRNEYTFLSEITLPNLNARTRGLVVVAELAKYAIADFLSNIDGSAALDERLYPIKLGKAAVGLDVEDIRYVIRDLWCDDRLSSPVDGDEDNAEIVTIQEVIEKGFQVYRKDNGL